jgi:CRISPR-associated endonuclease Csn1
MKIFIRNEFENQFAEDDERNKFNDRLQKLYHPSILDTYPKAKEEYYKHHDIEKQMIMLGSPKIGAWKNPMALRALHELKKLMNYLIATGEIDTTTRVVVEIAREGTLEDTNKRWAYEYYHRTREEENKEFAEAIRELIKRENIHASPDSDSDIDKFRLWYEMIESAEGYEDKSKKIISVDEDRTYGEIKKKNNKKRNLKTKDDSEENEEEKYYTFNENHFDKIKKEVWLKLKKAKDNIEERYRLWKHQQYFCIYTNKLIKITDLFNPNLIDVEHTIPRSISFDNSLANKTVCYADYNRNIKKNKIPADLGDDYIGIKQRIEKWEQKVKDIEVRVAFWKGKSKQASTKEYKDTCIRQKHLWQFELDYWRNKVERFTMTEVKPGFKNSQLKDTQLISKYAFHYLKSYFSKVDVQKGAVTAEFRKIFDIQRTDTPKDRSKHSHHAKDAIVLSVIPVAAIRDKMLEVWYKIDEQTELLKSNMEKNKDAIREGITQLQEELYQLKLQCNLPKGLNNTINKLDETILVNNIARNRSLLPASKKTKVKGKLRIATGDAIRGQLHKDSFFGAIKLVKKDENGKWIKDDKGEFEFEPIKYVIREELVYKANAQSPGFKDLNDLENQIVDKHLFNIIKKQIDEIGNFKEALKQGICMLDKNGNKVNKIRRVRIELRDKGPVEVKQQTNVNMNPSKILPNRNHKQKYYAANGKNIAYAVYEDINGSKGFEMLSLFAAGKLKKTVSIDNLADFFPQAKLIGKAKREGKLVAVLQPNQKVIFYRENINELTELSQEDLTKRLYMIISLYGKTTGQVQFQHHLEARPDKELSVGISKVNFENVEPRYLLSPSSFDFAIEGKHFEIKPGGEIKWRI